MQEKSGLWIIDSEQKNKCINAQLASSGRFTHFLAGFRSDRQTTIKWLTANFRNVGL